MKITPGSVPSPICLGVFDMQTTVTCSTHYLELPQTYEFSMILKSTTNTEAVGQDLGDSFTKSRDAFLADRLSKLSLLVVGDANGKVSCFELNPFLNWKGLKPQPLHPCKALKESRLMRGEHLAAHKSVVLSLGLNINLSNFTDKLPEPDSTLYSLSKLCHFSARIHKGRVAGVVYPPGTRYHLGLGADDKLLKAITTSGLDVASRSVVLNSSKGSSWKLDLNMKYKTASEVTEAYIVVQEIKSSAKSLESQVVQAFMHFFQNGGISRQETYINRSSIRLKNSVLSRQQNQHERMLLEKYNEELRKSDTAIDKLPSTFLTQVLTEGTSLSSRFRRRESSKGKRFFDLVQNAMSIEGSDNKASYRKSRIMSHLSSQMDQNLSESKFNRKSLLETQQLTSLTKDTDIKQRLMQLFNKGDDGAVGKGKRGGISGGILNRIQQKARGGFAIKLNNAAIPDKLPSALGPPALPYNAATQMRKSFRVSFAKLPGETTRRHHMQTSSVGSLRLCRIMVELRLTLRDSESCDKSKEPSPKRVAGSISQRGWKGASVLSQNLASHTAGIELFRTRVEKVLGENERQKIEFELNLKPSIGDFGTDNQADVPRNLKERIFALLDSKRPDGGERSPSKKDSSPNRRKAASSFSETVLKLDPSTTERGGSQAKKAKAEDSSSDVHLTSKAPSAKFEVPLNKQSFAASQKLLVAHEQFMQSLVAEYRAVDSKSQLSEGARRSGSAPRSFPHSKVIKHAVLFK